MRSTTRVAVVIVLLVVAAGAIAGLLGPDTARTADPLPPDLRRVADERPLRIGWFDGAPPVSIWDGGTLLGGFGIEQWNLMAIKAGIEVEHVRLDGIPDVVEALRDGTIDIAGTQGQRPDLLAFAEPTEPLAWERITFVGSRDQPVQGLGTLEGRRVSTIAGSPLETVLMELYPTADYVLTDSLPAGLAAAEAGDIDLYLAPLAVAGYAISQGTLDLTPVGRSQQIIPIAAWGRAGEPPIEIARIARSLLSDEEISLLTVRFTGFDLGRPRTGVNASLRRALLVAGAALLVLLVFVLTLRQRVRAATAELRELNDQLESRVAARTEDLRISNEALSRFALTAAHDLRGPVSAIAGTASLLDREGLTDAQRATLRSSIRLGAKRLGEMVDALFQDAVDSGGDRPTIDGPSFAEWLEEIVGPELHATGSTLVVSAPPQRIDADLAVLLRAALNLVGNAIKYGLNLDGTRIEVELQRLVPDRWQLTVIDNGPGVSPEDAERIFEAGVQLHDDEDGFGHGLHGVRSRVQDVGGTITVGPAEGGGARFDVVLPALTRATATVETAPAS